MNACLIDDLSKVTTISNKKFQCLTDLAIDCLCSDLLELLETGEEMVSIDVGIGTLNILVCDDSIKYKFVPSTAFEDKLVDTYVSGENPLEKRVESALYERLLDTRKELL